jgi:hypothetical protein
MNPLHMLIPRYSASAQGHSAEMQTFQNAIFWVMRKSLRVMSLNNIQQQTENHITYVHQASSIEGRKAAKPAEYDIYGNIHVSVKKISTPSFFTCNITNQESNIS